MVGDLGGHHAAEGGRGRISPSSARLPIGTKFIMGRVSTQTLTIKNRDFYCFSSQILKSPCFQEHVTFEASTVKDKINHAVAAGEFNSDALTGDAVSSGCMTCSSTDEMVEQRC